MSDSDENVAIAERPTKAASPKRSARPSHHPDSDSDLVEIGSPLMQQLPANMCVNLVVVGGNDAGPNQRSATATTSTTTTSSAANGQTPNSLCANLPILFAQGYPINLEQIGEAQLEKFIPFMVRCSLGVLSIGTEFNYTEPEWWPEDVPFAIPVQRPPAIAAGADWHAKLKEIVLICYSFHKVLYLLQFADDLMRYKRCQLRFIDNMNATSSMYHRTGSSNKLLVTFRNENMRYDEAPRMKKTLLPRNENNKPNNGDSSSGSADDPDDCVPFDIYLCDYCDSELYSLQAFIEHEQDCNRDDEVIFCGSVPASDVQPSALRPNASNDGHIRDSPAAGCSVDAPNDVGQQQAEFMHAFGMFSRERPLPRHLPVGPEAKPIDNHAPVRKPAARGRYPRRAAVRPWAGWSKNLAVPISSPAGRVLTRVQQDHLSDGTYVQQRLARLDELCSAQPLHSRTFQSSHAGNGPPAFRTAQPSRTFKAPPDYDEIVARQYRFPLRQLSQRRFAEAPGRLLVNETRVCLPLRVIVQRLSPNTMNRACVEQRWRRELAELFPRATNFSLNRMLAERRRKFNQRRDRRIAQRLRAPQSPAVSPAHIVDLVSSEGEDNGAPDGGKQPAKETLLGRLMRTADLTLSVMPKAAGQSDETATALPDVVRAAAAAAATAAAANGHNSDDDIEFVSVARPNFRIVHRQSLDAVDGPASSSRGSPSTLLSTSLPAIGQQRRPSAKRRRVEDGRATGPQMPDAKRPAMHPKGAVVRPHNRTEPAERLTPMMFRMSPMDLLQCGRVMAQRPEQPNSDAGQPEASADGLPIVLGRPDLVVERVPPEEASASAPQPIGLSQPQSVSISIDLT